MEFPDEDYLRGALCFGGFGQMAKNGEHPPSPRLRRGKEGIEQRVRN
jgi:hypothetical protein